MMASLHVGEENSISIELYYEDQGTGVPALLIHGFPLSGHFWQKPVPVLLNAVCRVITVDRRGFAGSSRAADAYDCGTFPRDLDTPVTLLDPRDAVPIGHAGGAGAAVHY